MNLYPRKILIGLQEGYCNLKCGKCYTHGPTPISDNERPRGFMEMDDLRKLLDEISAFKPRVTPQTWDEPFLHPQLMDCLFEMKSRDLTVTMDTNGLLLDQISMKKLIDLKIDSVFISLDAKYSATYKKVRGVDKLDELTSKVHEFLTLRGNALLPRIGVSFVIEAENRDEKEAFIEYWKQYVDVIRVNEAFISGRELEIKPEGERTSCWSLEDSLMIHPNGEAALCCVDTHYENKIGNVFKEGVVNIWNGPFFTTVRENQKNGIYSKICQSCDLWSHSKAVKSETEDTLISETKTHSYINRKDRLKNAPENRFF